MGLRLNGRQGLRPKRASGIAVSVKKCRKCELIYCDPEPIPASIEDHYAVEADAYFPDSYFDNDDTSFDSATAKRLVGFSPGARALDIGAGVGKVVRVLRDDGWDAFGLEPSAPFIRWAIERVGIAPGRMAQGTIEDASFEPESFDLITFGAVLEHLYSPGEAIAKAMAWLRPGGIIHAEVPSSRYLVAKVLNAYFRMRGVNFVTNLSPMHPPYHLFEFSHRGFEAHGQRVGYELAEHEYWAGTLPNPLHRALRPVMARTGRGLQLTVWLRKAARARQRTPAQ